jgi:medium-chain acyl-[acyl-carrier-protein] hydrolase
MFRLWCGALGEAIDVCPVLLPGRESRLRETPIARIEPLVTALEEHLSPFMTEPFAFLGHSMGTAVAFELTHRLRAQGRPTPRVLALAGRRAPHRVSHHNPVHDKPDDALIARLRELDGTPEEVLASQELMSLILPVIRADFALVETYRPDLSRPPLDCPLLVYGGADDEDASREELEAWRDLTTGFVNAHVLPGGHFFLHDDRQRFLNLLRSDLETFVPAHP